MFRILSWRFPFRPPAVCYQRDFQNEGEAELKIIIRMTIYINPSVPACMTFVFAIPYRWKRHHVWYWEYYAVRKDASGIAIRISARIKSIGLICMAFCPCTSPHFVLGVGSMECLCSSKRGVGRLPLEKTSLTADNQFRSNNDGIVSNVMR